MKKRRLIIGMLLLSVVFAATSASFSIAWYASATRLRVEEFVISIDGDRQLQIATEEEGNYVSELTTPDLRKTKAFTAVSTCYRNTWAGEDEPTFYDMSYRLRDTSGVPYLKPAPKPGVSNNPAYFSQALWLKPDIRCYVGIDYEKTSILPNQEKNEAYAEQLAKEDGDPSKKQAYLEQLNNIHNCARVSLLVDDDYFIIDPNHNEEGPIYYGGALDNDNDRYYDFYTSPKDHEKYEVFYGELKEGYSREDLVYLDAPAEDIPASGAYNAFTARHQAGVHILDLESSKPYIATEPRLLEKDFEGMTPAFCLASEAYKPQRVVVSFYLEGWDLDSINNVMGASFDIALSFKIIRER